MTDIDRDSRRYHRIEPGNGEVGSCRHCGRRTWPMGRDNAGHRMEQCLYCLQRYDVDAIDPDLDEDSVDLPEE